MLAGPIPFDHGALSFFKKVRRDAFKGHGNRGLAIGQLKGQPQSIGIRIHAPFDDHATHAHLLLIVVRGKGFHFRGGKKVYHVFPKIPQGEVGQGSAHQKKTDDHPDLFLSRHHFFSPSSPLSLLQIPSPIKGEDT